MFVLSFCFVFGWRFIRRGDGANRSLFLDFKIVFFFPFFSQKHLGNPFDRFSRKDFWQQQNKHEFLFLFFFFLNTHVYVTVCVCVCLCVCAECRVQFLCTHTHEKCHFHLYKFATYTQYLHFIPFFPLKRFFFLFLFFYLCLLFICSIQAWKNTQKKR